MSKYTTEVRFICESSAGLEESKGFNSIDEILDNCIDKIFDFDFPIFDETYRPVLEKKILKHYYTREIATETVGLWKHFLDTRLNEIMPFYNKLYESELLEFNPLYDVDLTTKRDNSRKNNGTIEDNGDSDYTRTDNLLENHKDSDKDIVDTAPETKNTRRQYYSDTPQGAVTGVENENYLTNYTKIVDDATGSKNKVTTTYGRNTEIRNNGTQRNAGTNNNLRTLNTETTDDYVEHVAGKTGGITFSRALQEFRQTLLNIDMQIIEELSDLFFGLW